MKLNYELKGENLRICNENLKGEPLLYSIPYDIGENGMYQEGFFVITPMRFFLITEGKVIQENKITDYDKYIMQKGIGSGSLEGRIYTDKEKDRTKEDADYTELPKRSEKERALRIVTDPGARIVGFTTGFLGTYTQITRVLNELREDGVTNVIGEYVETICPKCGRPYVWGTQLCRKCTGGMEGLKKITRLLKAYIVPLVIMISLFSITIANSVFSPMLNRWLVDDYIRPNNAELGGFMFIIGLMTVLTIFMTLYHVIRGKIMAKLGLNIARDLRKAVFEKIHSLSLDYIDKKRQGDLMHRVTHDTEHLESFIADDICWGFSQIATLVVLGVVIFFINWQMALMVVLPLPLIILYINWVRKKYRVTYHNQWKIEDRAASTLQDIISGIKVVKVFGTEEREVKRYSDASLELANLMAKNERMYNTYQPIMWFLISIGTFFVTYMGGTLILQDRMTVGELVQFSTYAGIIYGPIAWITHFPRALTHAVTAAERIMNVLDEIPTVKLSEDYFVENAEGRISIKNVTFGYKSYEPVLKNINIEVQPGEMIGLVGHSGSGKSTLINLIMRLYDPDDGSISLDGKDLRFIEHETLRKHIGVVLQETFLFSGTILQNIRYSKPSATLEEIIEAAKVANAHNFIIKFPDGYDTYVGERGQRLSVGEKQRIAIARAILNDPKILILDEATASVDTETDASIQEALGRLIKSRTTFAIAHRLSTLKNATRLMVIDRGKVIELGSHDELMKLKGKYYSLVMTQNEMHKVRGYSG